MIRAILVACGTFITLTGALLFGVERVVLTEPAAARLQAMFDRPESPLDSIQPAEIDPPDWSAAGLLSMGGVVLLYTLVVPAHRSDDDEEFEED